MPMAAINAYLGELPGLLAEWRLHMMEAAMLPHMRESARKRTWRDTEEQAYGDDRPAVVHASPQALALLGIGVQIVRGEHGKPG